MTFLFAVDSYVARDLGGGDPERMAPPNFATYVQELFAGSAVQVEVISNRKIFEQEYPLFAAVDRAANCKQFVWLKTHSCS